MSKGKKILLTLAVPAALFLAYNLFWAASVWYTYKDYWTAVPKQHGRHYAFDEQNQVTYNVKTPNYLSFTGNLGITDGNKAVLLIWPSLYNRSFTYGISIQDETGAYEIYINEDLEAVTGYEEEQEVIQRNHAEIERLVQLAQEKFF